MTLHVQRSYKNPYRNKFGIDQEKYFNGLNLCLCVNIILYGYLLLLG